MERKDNQTVAAELLQKPVTPPQTSTVERDPMVVTNQAGERVQLGEKPQQTK
jgi:hypothetical protein